MDEIQRLLARESCRELSYRYCRHLDHLDADAFAALWTEDAIYHPAALAEPLVGRNRILEWITAYPSQRLGRHLSTNQLVDLVDETCATGSSYSVVFREPAPREGHVSNRVVPRSVVEYVDEYRCTDDVWRFASRVYTFCFREDSRGAGDLVSDAATA